MEISLALGGGGVKGIAHIGVLDCLVKEGFHIQAIAGTSAGGLVGAMFAAGYPPEEIRTIIEGINPTRMYSRQPHDGPSLLGNTGIAETLFEILGNYDFSDLRIPFACTAVDLKTSQEVYLNDGPVVDALLATMAIPGIFPAKRRGDAELIDGGVLDPVPVNLARSLLPTKPVIAVALNPEKEQWPQLPQVNLTPPIPLPIPPPIIESISRMRVAQAFLIFTQSIDLSARMIAELRLEIDHPDVIIRPDVHKYGLLDTANPGELIQAGYDAAEQAIPQIRKAGSWTNTVLRFMQQPFQKEKRQPVFNLKKRSNSHPGASQ